MCGIVCTLGKKKKRCLEIMFVEQLIIFQHIKHTILQTSFFLVRTWLKLSFEASIFTHVCLHSDIQKSQGCQCNLNVDTTYWNQVKQRYRLVDSSLAFIVFFIVVFFFWWWGGSLSTLQPGSRLSRGRFLSYFKCCNEYNFFKKCTKCLC